MPGKLSAKRFAPDKIKTRPYQNDFTAVQLQGRYSGSVWPNANLPPSLVQYMSDDDDDLLRTGPKQKYKLGQVGYKLTLLNPLFCMSALNIWSEENDIILTPLGSRGISGLVANLMKRHAIVNEIVPQYYEEIKTKAERRRYQEYRFDCILGDARHLSLEDDSIDCIYTSPPYWRQERYIEVEGSLGTLETYEKFLEGWKECVEEMYRVLKPNKFCCIVIGDFRYNGQLINYSGDTIILAREIGFKYWDWVTLCLRTSAKIFASKQLEKYKHVARSHEILLVFKKEG